MCAFFANLPFIVGVSSKLEHGVYIKDKGFLLGDNILPINQSNAHLAAEDVEQGCFLTISRASTIAFYL